MSKFIQALQPGMAAAIIALAVIISGSTVVPNTYAQEAENATERQNTQSTDERDRLRSQQREALEAKQQEAKTSKEAAEARLKARHEARQEKLSASQLEICKNRESNINNRIGRIGERGAKHIALFNSISERAQNFYANKGNTLENYGQLIDDVTNKQIAAEAALSVVTNMKAAFDCEGADPKSTIEDFRTRVQAAVFALKEYRTSIKNLIVGIKSVNSVQTDNSKTAEDTES